MNTTFLASLTLLCATAATGFAAPGNSRTFSSGNKQVSLLELYTSEGCSSCPPAEAWLSRLTTQPKLWEDVVPVAFHVDYWDYLGWRDRFASSAATSRQRAYAAAWGDGSVYTPGFVLNGHEWQQWSGVPAGELPPGSAGAANAGQLRATVEDGRKVAVSYQPAAGHAAPAAQVTVALLGSHLTSSVKAGENRGRSLSHDFVVLVLETKSLSAGTHGEQTAEIELPTAPADADRLALAAWVQQPGNGAVVQATGGWLSGPAASRP